MFGVVPNLDTSSLLFRTHYSIWGEKVYLSKGLELSRICLLCVAVLSVSCLELQILRPANLFLFSKGCTFDILQLYN